MSKRKVGLILFLTSIVWSIAWGVIGSVEAGSVMNALTFEELNRTAWALAGPLIVLWTVGGVPLGAVIAGIGLLIYSGAKASTVWKFGIGMVSAIMIVVSAMFLRHMPPLFGIGGSLILLFFLGTLWFWAKERMILVGSSKIAADFKLAGYVFMLIAVWFTCGLASQQFLKSFEGQIPYSPLHIIASFVLGWFFLFLSHYRLSHDKELS